MQMDLSQEWRTWDNLEPATLRSRRTSGDMIDTVLQAKRRKISTHEAAASGGAYQSGDVRFLLPAVLVLNGPPKPGDSILDLERNRFTVLTVDGQKRDKNGYTTWACGCRNLAIAYDLADLSVVIEEPRVSLQGAGVGVRGWRVAFTGFRCKVIKLLDEVAEERAIRGFKGTYAVYLEEELAVTDQMRVVWSGAPTGYLEILKYHPAAALGDLPVIDCEAVP